MMQPAPDFEQLPEYIPKMYEKPSDRYFTDGTNESQLPF